jgi:phenylalanyl-tRNA synthetase beta chain
VRRCRPGRVGAAGAGPAGRHGHGRGRVVRRGQRGGGRPDQDGDGGGDTAGVAWNKKASKADYYFVKGICERILSVAGISNAVFETTDDASLETAANIKVKNKTIGLLGAVSEETLKIFGIKQPVFFADIYWDALMETRKTKAFSYAEVSKYPAVQRDLAMIVPKELAWEQVQKTVEKIKLNKLQDIKLFDIFESEKLGAGKKSVAVNFTFLYEEKTLTDKEIDGWMSKIMTSLEKDLQAEIRK